MTYDQIIRDIDNKIYSSIYFLQGEEPYFIDSIVEKLEDNILDESMKSFNQSIIYGRDTNPEEIIDLCKRYPMMGNYQVVIVKEAQNILKIDELEPYIAKPLDTTILIIAYKNKKIDKRTAFYKAISNKNINSVVFNSEKIKEYAIPKWIESEIKQRGYTISPVALMLVSEYLGNDLGKITNEISKLVINISPGSHITEYEIEENIGISKDYNVFELQKAFVDKDALKTFRIIEFFESNPKDHPLQMISVLLNNYFLKVFRYHFIKNYDKNKIAGELGVSPYFVKDYVKAGRVFTPEKVKSIISNIRLLDLKSKGLYNNESTSYGPLKELAFSILN